MPTDPADQLRALTKSRRIRDPLIIFVPSRKRKYRGRCRVFTDRTKP